MENPHIHFSDYFNVDPNDIESYGAFNISLINDLPLFIDPFLLFNSRKPEYQSLHDQMIDYLRFLRDKSRKINVKKGLLNRWYSFPEVMQTWLGFSISGNQGRGLGLDFAESLNKNLHNVFKDFGNEKITLGSHLEKLCLIRDGIGKDNISDFTTNLIKEYLLTYTQSFAKNFLKKQFLNTFHVEKVRFNYRTESWETGQYILPNFQGNYVLLTPKDILTKDDIWINKNDLITNYDGILSTMPNNQLRDQLNNYLLKILPEDPTPKEKRLAIMNTILNHPEYIEYYIRYKEENGENAVSVSEERVRQTEELFVTQIKELSSILFSTTKFYEIAGDSYSEARDRVEFLKDVIENKGGWRLFYLNEMPITRESDLQILYRLTWFATSYDVSREVDDGRGPADYKISNGSRDKTIVEMKLASNPQLKQNLQKQAEIYQKASDAQNKLKVIIYFNEKELERVKKIIDELDLKIDKDVILIDARSDNKPSASRA
jgi:hypothetical protein